MTVKHTAHIREVFTRKGLEADGGKELILARVLGCAAYMRAAGIDEIHSLSAEDEHCLVIGAIGGFAKVVNISLAAKHLKLAHAHNVACIVVEEYVGKCLGSKFGAKKLANILLPRFGLYWSYLKHISPP